MSVTLVTEVNLNRPGNADDKLRREYMRTFRCITNDPLDDSGTVIASEWFCGSVRAGNQDRSAPGG